MDYSDYNARTNGSYKEIWPNTGKCVFCDLREKYIVKTNERAALTVNLFPYIDGNLLVVPKRHVEDYYDITQEEGIQMQELAKEGIKLLREVLGIEEVWLLHRAPGGNKANKTVAHSHMLVLPYKEGLASWDYQEITIPPLELAKKLRSNL